MANALTQSCELFVERVSPNHPSADGQCFRLGYRTKGKGDILAAVDLPVHVLEQEIASGLEMVVTVTPPGEVVAQIVGSSGFNLLGPRSITPIQDLVSEAVSTDNLRLEEATASELRGFLRALESAIDHVRTALARTRVEDEQGNQSCDADLLRHFS